MKHSTLTAVWKWSGIVAVVFIITLFATLAHADATCVGNQPQCGNTVSNTTNAGIGVGLGGQGGNVNNSGNSSSSSVGLGVGLGGQGGAGGSSTAVGVGLGGAGGAGGSVAGSGNSDVDNTNVGLNLQGQQQGQQQSSTNVGVNGQSQSSDNANNSSQSVTVEGDTYDAAKIPASTAIAPTMFATAMCQAARSGAFQNRILGISLGGTITDENCMRLEQFRVIGNFIHDDETLTAMACLASPLFAEARKRMGQPCAEAVAD
jgi:hypothetical protein